jgi:hypothetical protein
LISDVFAIITQMQAVREENDSLEARNAQLQVRRVALQDIARKTQGMMSHMRKELLWLAEEKEKVMQEGKETIEKDREKHRRELAKVLAREQDLLAQALVTTAMTQPSGRYATRGSPRRRVAPTTTPGRTPRMVRCDLMHLHAHAPARPNADSTRLRIQYWCLNFALSMRSGHDRPSRRRIAVGSGDNCIILNVNHSLIERSLMFDDHSV